MNAFQISTAEAKSLNFLAINKIGCLVEFLVVQVKNEALVPLIVVLLPKQWLDSHDVGTMWWQVKGQVGYSVCIDNVFYSLQSLLENIAIFGKTNQVAKIKGIRLIKVSELLITYPKLFFCCHSLFMDKQLNYYINRTAKFNCLAVLLSQSAVDFNSVFDFSWLHKLRKSVLRH